MVKCGRPIGIAISEDYSGVDCYAQVQQVMGPDLMVIGYSQFCSDTARLCCLCDDLGSRRLHLVTVVDKGQPVGIITSTGTIRSSVYRMATDDVGKQRIGVAIGVNDGIEAKAAALIWVVIRPGTGGHFPLTRDESPAIFLTWILP